MPLPHKPFYFMRHGETDWNRRHVAMGQQDIPLNERGIEQAHEARELLKEMQFQHIVCSPLLRAQKTAEIIKGNTAIPLIFLDDLKESSWGILEGKEKGDGSWFDKWRAGIEIEGAESYETFSKRVLEAFNRALQNPGPVLIIAHGGVYWPIQEALKLPYQDLPNCTPVYHNPPQNGTGKWHTSVISNHEEYEVI